MSCDKLLLYYMDLMENYKLIQVILSTMIFLQNFYWSMSFILKKCFIPVLAFKSFRFFLQKINTNFPTTIINKCDYISFASVKKMELLAYKYQNEQSLMASLLSMIFLVEVHLGVVC